MLCGSLLGTQDWNENCDAQLRGVWAIESKLRQSNTLRILSSSETIVVAAQCPAWLEFPSLRTGFKIYPIESPLSQHSKYKPMYLTVSHSHPNSENFRPYLELTHILQLNYSCREQHHRSLHGLSPERPTLDVIDPGARKSMESVGMLSSNVIRVIPHSECKTKGKGECGEWQIVLRLLQPLCSVQSAQCEAWNSHWHRLDISKGHLHAASTGSTPPHTAMPAEEKYL